MAQHKAPTAVTIAPISEKSALEAWISKYWVHFALAFLAVIAFVVVRHFRHSSRVQLRDDSWAKIGQQTTPNVYTGIPSGDPGALGVLADELRGTGAGPSARLYQAYALLEEDRYDEALTTLQELRADSPNFEPVTTLYVFREGEEATTLIEYLRGCAERRQAWMSAHPELSGNPDAPAGSPEVVIKTAEGELAIRLYADEAPQHVDNFLKLAREGYYNGTKFHRVTGQSGGMAMIQGGDPNSRDDEDRSTWGQGGPDYKIPFEKNSLRHFRGVLSMAKKGADIDSSGSQFFITTAPAHHLDGKHVVFGQVVSGLEVADKIIETATFQPEAPDMPEAPVVLEAIEVVQ